MKKRGAARILALCIAIAMAAVSCDTSQTPESDDSGGKGDRQGLLNVAFVWTYHEPLGLSDPGDVDPAVRASAARHYPVLPHALGSVPDSKATIVVSSTTLDDLGALSSGVSDELLELSGMSVTGMSEAQRERVLEQLFQVPEAAYSTYPRLAALRESHLSGEVLNETDILDLQVLYGLSWVGETQHGNRTVAAVSAKGTNFDERDRDMVVAAQHSAAETFLKKTRESVASGKAELAGTTDANAIAPLLIDGWIGISSESLDVRSENRFNEETDASAAIRRGLDAMEDTFGIRPIGMALGGGSVSEKTTKLLDEAGVGWALIGEASLATSLGLPSQRRVSQTVGPDDLYRPWQTPNHGLFLFPTDDQLGYLISDVYPNMDSSEAADDLVRRLEEIAASAEVPAIVTIEVDGSVPWEHYDDGGRSFLVDLFEKISRSERLGMTTPSAFIDALDVDPKRLPSIWPGARRSPSLDTWVGEAEEATAWNLLWLVRHDLRLLSREGRIPDVQIFEAFEAMGIAESGDWFRWFGTDADSGDDRRMDELFRQSLGLVYDKLREPRSAALEVPLIPARSEVRAEDGWHAPAGTLNIEWTEGGPILSVGLPNESAGFTVWVSKGHDEPTPTAESGLALGMTVRQSYRWSADSPGAVVVGLDGIEGTGTEESLAAIPGEEVVTFTIPEDLLHEWEVGEPLRFRVETTDVRGESQGLIPQSGPAQILAGVTTLIDVSDPHGDDRGPGSYTYPQDERFNEGALDVISLEFGISGESVVVGLTLAADISNPFRLASGVGLQVIDVALDVDPGTARGRRSFPGGRNVSLDSTNGYEGLLTVDGGGAILKLVDDAGELVDSEVNVDLGLEPALGLITLKFPLEALGNGHPPQRWGIAAVVSAADVNGPGHVRTVETRATQWSGGGANADSSHSNVYDVVWPDQRAQESFLADYRSVSAGDNPDEDDYPSLPLILIGAG